MAKNKKILILSDSGKLGRVVERNLQGKRDVFHCDYSAPQEHSGKARRRRFALIIVALCRSDSEPIVALARAGQGKRLGCVPLLIISDRPFQVAPAEKIHHLDFPFAAEALLRRVEAILSKPPSAGTPLE